MPLLKFLRDAPFRVRTVERDRRSDLARLAKLRQFLDDLGTEIIRERDGLRARHDSVATRAAFSQLALEETPGDSAMMDSIGDLTKAMIRYDARIKALEEQIAFVTGIRRNSDLFPLENEAVEASDNLAGQKTH